MNYNNNIPSYNVTHISSYVNGTMSREDMYAFEKAMQTDPLLEDAVEGFRTSNISKAEIDLAAIKAAILPKKKSSKIIPFYTAYKTWFSAAAAIIVIATIGTVTFAILKPNSANQQVAIVTPSTEKPKAFVDTSHNISPTISTYNAKPTISSSKKQPVIAADRKVLAAENIKATNDWATTSTHIDSNKNGFYDDAVSHIKAEELKEVKISTIDQLLQGKLAGVNINNKLSTKIRAMNTINSNNGFTTNTNTAKDSTQTAKNTLDEVIVVGYGTTKREDVTGSVATRAIDPLDSLMPVGGWQYYSKYMNQKIGFIGDTTSNNSLVIRDRTGNKLDDIDIEFSVDQEGNAYNVKVITDIDSTKAKTIANAVVEGPKWISQKKKNKAKISLKTP
ncbi:MAG: hypothetical protein QM541_06660 [Flavobacterium sp.]|nr:hypothetical protein [Flavobacterium sp.]